MMKETGLASGVFLLRIVTRPRLIEKTRLFYGEDVAGGVNHLLLRIVTRPRLIEQTRLYYGEDVAGYVTDSCWR